MKRKAVYKKKKIDNKTLKNCISSVYSGPAFYLFVKEVGVEAAASCLSIENNLVH